MLFASICYFVLCCVILCYRMDASERMIQTMANMLRREIEDVREFAHHGIHSMREEFQSWRHSALVAAAVQPQSSKVETRGHSFSEVHPVSTKAIDPENDIEIDNSTDLLLLRRRVDDLEERLDAITNNVVGMEESMNNGFQTLAQDLRSERERNELNANKTKQLISTTKESIENEIEDVVMNIGRALRAIQENQRAGRSLGPDVVVDTHSLLSPRSHRLVEAERVQISRQTASSAADSEVLDGDEDDVSSTADVMGDTGSEVDTTGKHSVAPIDALTEQPDDTTLRSLPSNNSLNSSPRAVGNGSLSGTPRNNNRSEEARATPNTIKRTHNESENDSSTSALIDAQNQKSKLVQHSPPSSVKKRVRTEVASEFTENILGEHMLKTFGLLMSLKDQRSNLESHPDTHDNRKYVAAVKIQARVRGVQSRDIATTSSKLAEKIVPLVQAPIQSRDEKIDAETKLLSATTSTQAQQQQQQQINQSPSTFLARLQEKSKPKLSDPQSTKASPIPTTSTAIDEKHQGAVTIQARVRGAQTRQRQVAGEPSDDQAVDAETTSTAATKIQARVRGAQARRSLDREIDEDSLSL